MAALEKFLKEAKETKGIKHIAVIRNLRGYMEITSEKELIDAIESIQDITLIRYLLEAGLKPPLLRAALKRYEILEKRIKGGISE
jgi:hypothetical protein